MLRLLHPFMPFITEEIWQTFKQKATDAKAWAESLMFAGWPHEKGTGFHDEGAQKAIGLLQDAVSGIRDLRVRYQIAPTDKLTAVVVCKEQGTLETVRAFEHEVKVLGRLAELQCVREFQKKGVMAAASFAAFDIFISLEGILDPEEEKERLQKKIRETEQWIETIRKKVENPSFAEKAPKEILEKEKEKLADAKKLLISYQAQLAGF
jgi:valyl-tRNA synthetase